MASSRAYLRWRESIWFLIWDSVIGLPPKVGSSVSCGVGTPTPPPLSLRARGEIFISAPFGPVLTHFVAGMGVVMVRLWCCNGAVRTVFLSSFRWLWKGKPSPPAPLPEGEGRTFLFCTILARFVAVLRALMVLCGPLVCRRFYESWIPGPLETEVSARAGATGFATKRQG